MGIFEPGLCTSIKRVTDTLSVLKERKKEIYEYVISKVLAPEKIGMRTREKPLWGGKAEGEDGGFWFSLGTLFY